MGDVPDFELRLWRAWDFECNGGYDTHPMVCFFAAAEKALRYDCHARICGSSLGDVSYFCPAARTCFAIRTGHVPRRSWPSPNQNATTHLTRSTQ
jgi:hypothetical protein